MGSRRNTYSNYSKIQKIFIQKIFIQKILNQIQINSHRIKKLRSPM